MITDVEGRAQDEKYFCGKKVLQIVIDVLWLLTKNKVSVSWNKEF